MSEEKTENEIDMDKISQNVIAFFKKDFKNKLDVAISALLSYSLNQDKESLSTIRRFFHTINGTGSILGLLEISQSGAYYEKYLDNLLSEDSLFPEDYKNILIGIETLKILNEKIAIAPEPELTDTILSTPYQVAVNSDRLSVSSRKSNSEKVSVSSISLDNSSILVVDDDIVLLNMLEQHLRQEGMQVMVADNHNLAMEILQAKKIDIILLDVLLPGLDGFSLIYEIKKLWPDKYVIFISSKANPEDKIKGLQSGASDFIAKPFDIKELIARIQVGKKHTSKENELKNKDPESGLYNRIYFENYLNELMEEVSINPIHSAIIMISFKDLEKKPPENNIGNLEKILHTFAIKFKEVFTNLTFKYSDTEFILILPNQGKHEAASTIESFREWIRNVSSPDLNISSSWLGAFNAGISDISQSDKGLVGIIDRLAQAVTISKRVKNNKTIVFDPLVDLTHSHNPKILIIDDDEVIIRLIKTRLENLSFEIIHASDGEKGLEASIRFIPDIILLDLMLPVMDGFEVVENIRKNPELNNSKIIMVSAKKDEETVKRAFLTGVDDYIVKPFSLLEIEMRINKTLKEMNL